MKKLKDIKQYSSYAFGAFGHDAFYATLSTYFMILLLANYSIQKMPLLMQK